MIPIVKLGDICKMQSGGTPRRNNPSFYKNGTIPWIKIGDIENAQNGWITETEESITELGLKSINNRIFPKGTLFFAMYGSVGKTALAGTVLSTNQAILGIQPKEESLNVKYLNYWLKSRIKEFKHLSRGVALKNLSATIMKEQKIPLPPLKTQKKIAAILDKAYELRRNDQKILEKYDQLAQSVFLKMFGDPVTNPKGWVVNKFGDYIEYLGDIGSNGSNETVANNLVMYDTEDYAIMIRTVNLNSNNFSKNIKYISKKTYDFFSKSQIFGGEIIMNKIGSAGEFWIMPNLDRPVSLGLNQFVIRLKRLNTIYLYSFLSTNYGKLNIKSRIRGVATKSITKSAVRELPLLYPPIDLQNQYALYIEKIEKQKQLTQQSLQKSEELFQSLLQKAFRGELGIEMKRG